MELTYHLEPKADESPLGYYRRLAGANGLRNWRELASLAKASPSRTGLLSRPEHIAAMYNLPSEWTTAITQREESLKALRSLHRGHHDAVCPRCLSEDMYLRIGWEHGYVTACATHRTLLVERCPACDTFLSIHRERIEQCDCGQDLSSIPAVPAPSVHLWLSSLLLPGDDAPPGDLPDLRGTPSAELAELVRTLCLHFDPAAEPPRRNSANPGSVREALEFLAPLETLLAEWPVSYEQHVRTRIAAGPADARTLKTLLGPWFRHLLAVASTGALRSFLSPVIRIAAAEFDGVIGMEDAGNWDDLRYVRLKDAAKHGQMTVPTLRRAIAARQIEHRSRRFGTKGTVYEVLRTDLERIVEARRGWTTEAEACRSLGVSPKVLTNMVAAGLVDADYDWVKDVFKGGPFRAGAIADVQATLMTNLAETPTAGERIGFADLTSRRLGDNTAIQALMRAIQSGEVVAQGPADRVGKLQYPLAEVRRFFGTPLLEAGLSVSQLAKLTGWKHESIDHWIETGLLESHPIVLRGQPCRVVMPAQLLAFNRTYMPVSDLARLVGGRSSFMAKRLAHIGVIAGKATSSGTQRGMLVRLSDVAELAMRTANLGVLAVRDGRAGRRRKPK
ncbi:TniQ family protein [Piscinibacter gummiphilus]|uniref:TniQ domain-containing protein n=1 Tax=Piscinibacter gummiphilus TaxID=946333 RepID=A0A1W6L2F8_9BURK|nr:TniQ family protein [Piscinibacter gummiphilus]ARN18439.1 hypothetical protein A4W93_00065 [Piscinibacter gummiphilus]ATU63068.1 hypothetical protein CPZ87_00070 [Piscinibacter gummiphilus]GLS98274.1 hypothetical protein GCM10007918_55660 [Piscinibacter gummiphilus]